MIPSSAHRSHLRPGGSRVTGLALTVLPEARHRLPTDLRPAAVTVSAGSLWSRVTRSALAVLPEAGHRLPADLRPAALTVGAVSAGSLGQDAGR